MPHLIVANWKMNPASAEEARVLASKVEHALLGHDRKRVQAVVCPPFVYLAGVKHCLHFAALGAQDAAPAGDGPLTGEVSAQMLKSFGVKYCIIGHSERRALGEDDEMINSKVHAAVKNGITPILCVGFGVKKGAAQAAIKRVIKSQITTGLKGIMGETVIAYEPVWAIGSGKPATPEHAAEILDFAGSFYPQARLLYGGSMDGGNAGEFAAHRVIEGGLVGGASLKPLEFSKIIKAFSV